MLATGAQAKDISRPQGSRDHTEEGGGVPQGTYHLEAFDYNEPEDTMVHNIPQSCPTEKEGVSTPKLSQTPQQNYTILQEVATFDYPATLCTVHRSQGYYDCV